MSQRRRSVGTATTQAGSDRYILAQDDVYTAPQSQCAQRAHHKVRFSAGNPGMIHRYARANTGAMAAMAEKGEQVMDINALENRGDLMVAILAASGDVQAEINLGEGPHTLAAKPQFMLHRGIPFRIVATHTWYTRRIKGKSTRD